MFVPKQSPYEERLPKLGFRQLDISIPNEPRLFALPSRPGYQWSAAGMRVAASTALKLRSRVLTRKIAATVFCVRNDTFMMTVVYEHHTGIGDSPIEIFWISRDLVDLGDQQYGLEFFDGSYLLSDGLPM